MPEPIRLDGNGKSGKPAGKPAGSGNSAGKPTVTNGSDIKPGGGAENQPQENAQTDSKGAAKSETIKNTGLIIVDGDTSGNEFEQPKRGPGKPRGSTNANSGGGKRG